MIPNHSPWIAQLNRKRPVLPIDSNADTDIVIVGGGIAGVSTAYFTLRYTKFNVILVEADMVAHGATGHNAGQIASYFERPLSELVKEFGSELAIDGQKSIESTWLLLEEIVKDAKLQTPLHRFTGYAGLSSFNQLLHYLTANLYRLENGLQAETIIVAEDWPGLQNIPEKFRDLYSLAPQESILKLLETKNKEYVASLAFEKGCMNSALFSEELVGYLIANYKDRFRLFEGSPVKSISLFNNKAILNVLEKVISGKRVVLCTNGFENFTIINKTGSEIDTAFHHLVDGRIGYMSGYIQDLDGPPTAISYFPKVREKTSDPTGETYYYLTRRPHEHEGRKSHNLVCAGGPERVLPNGALYSRNKLCDDEIRYEIHEFLKDNYAKYPSEDITNSFCWHGLMGYTPNGVRRIGSEPLNPTLLYNLGCNGVGILPSIFGGRRIARILNNERVEPSIFDPQTKVV